MIYMTYKNEEEREAARKYSNIISRKWNKKLRKQIKWSKKDFISWYINEPKKCSYCGSTLKEIQAFYKTSKSKRKLTRGKTLEIDRKIDNSYSRKNCVFACYWCNNAKSDEFSIKEFKPIAKAIRKIIVKKLNKI